MVILGGWVFLMSEVPLHWILPPRHSPPGVRCPLLLRTRYTLEPLAWHWSHLSFQSSSLRMKKVRRTEGPVPNSAMCTSDTSTSHLRFRGGLVFEAHRLLYHSMLGLRVIKKKKHVHQRYLDLAPATGNASEQIQGYLA